MDVYFDDRCMAGICDCQLGVTCFNRDVEWATYDRQNRFQDRVTAKFDAQDKAADPLAFYWKKGAQHIRDTFHKTLDFNPKPEQFYNKGKYHG